jgi:hypothetical protein
MKLKSRADLSFGNLDNCVDIRKASEIVTDNMTILSNESPGYHELKQRMSWFDEGRYWIERNKPNHNGFG